VRLVTFVRNSDHDATLGDEIYRLQIYDDGTVIKCDCDLLSLKRSLLVLVTRPILFRDYEGGQL